MKRLLVLLLAALLITGSLTACGSSSGGGAPAPPPAAGDLVTWRLTGSINASVLELALAQLGLNGLTITGSATCFKLSYMTPDVQGTLVRASGLLCLPVGRSSGNPVISYQHGTIFLDGDAPSAFASSAEGLVGAVLAGMGYIAVLPDYLGFGDSTDLLHPYLHAGTLASATVDMNRAGRTFLAVSGFDVSSNGQLFLAGYSEGGYATLATQRLMEQTLTAEFSITASEPGAGPYDLTETARTLLGLPTQAQPAFTGFFLKAYDSIYNSPGMLATYFSGTYADVVNTYFDGTYSRSEISAALGGGGVATSVLFNPVFLASYLGTGEQALKAHIAQNDIYNWAPHVPTRLFHGVEDDIVPYANATTTLAAMQRNGAPSVSLINCNAGSVATTHDNCAKPYALDMIAYFKTLATGI